MNRPLIAVVLALFSCVATSAQAGWWHHHHHQQSYAYAYPAYYPAYSYAAPTQVVQAQSGLGEILLLIESIRKLNPGTTGTGPGPSPPSPPSPVDTSSIRSDLADIKASLKDLDGRVENINSTVQKHGEAFGEIMTQLQELRGGRKSQAELLKAIQDNENLRTKLDDLFHGDTPAEKKDAREAAIKAIYEVLHKK